MDLLIIIITAAAIASPFSNGNFTPFLDYWNSGARAKITSKHKMIQSVCVPANHYLLHFQYILMPKHVTG